MVNTSLSKIFGQIGLGDKHVRVYRALLASPSATPLQLARETRLNRSSLYRYLEELRERGLVELVLGDKTSKYKVSPEGFERYLVSEEARVESLKKTIPALLSELSNKNNRVKSEVKYYQGVEGLKQMLWNVVASGQEYVGLGYENWNTSVGKSFAERLRAKNIEMGTSSRELLNEVESEFDYTALKDSYPSVYQHRAIDPKILTIKHDTYIYGDVFAYYYHYQGEYFGVEIHNQEIARTERQVFEILWKLAKEK